MLMNGEEIILASERDGYEHLYLFNGRTGVLENQITKGDWGYPRGEPHRSSQKRNLVCKRNEFR